MAHWCHVDAESGLRPATVYIRARKGRRWSYTVTATTLCGSSSQPPACPDRRPSSFDADYSAEQGVVLRTEARTQHACNRTTPAIRCPVVSQAWAVAPVVGWCVEVSRTRSRCSCSSGRLSAVCRPAPAARSDAHRRRALAPRAGEPQQEQQAGAQDARRVRMYESIGNLGREYGAR
ncbi:hypothetical protein K491DRAFT_14661 [Lophiostoma macrostomum CBS 122681]|uniref:Uncharacterized protein n=1 Tax=Lophiostoma macrostomum CBS 122681 TaxID=1314788 RepID=A0A6A6TMS3_9PLEO|nr:hypothetical protein K491DRAFT_14661 [Lophiostoma macrostomum CBS 122681]